MEHYSAKKNYKYKKIYIDNLSLEDIMPFKMLEDKFCYVLDRNETVIGCIGSQEYRMMQETGKPSIKKDFLFITTGQGEKQMAVNLFMENPKIMKIPVLDKKGRILYEYVRSQEMFYEELQIGCGVYTGEEREEEVVVSLTSYGKRLDTVFLSIKSVMHQTFKADKILLYIAKEDSHREIKNEGELVKAGLDIRRGVKDLKSHKKYLYAMQEFPESVIVTVDDDVLYDERLLEDLYKKHTEYPSSVICRRGHRMVKQGRKIAPYNSWDGCAVSTVPEKGICPTGVGGILYPCGRYRQAFADEKGILKTSLYGDDLWLKTIELLYGVDAFAIGEIPARVIRGSQQEALYIENAEHKRNDEYIEKLQDFFNINLADLF